LLVNFKCSCATAHSALKLTSASFGNKISAPLTQSKYLKGLKQFFTCF
jgi:hypothetical protein